MNFKKALITGGAGFIGSHLADSLTDAGCKVVILDNLTTGNLFNLRQIEEKITFYEGDIRDPEILDKAAKDCDVIFHEAAVVSVPQTVQNPVGSAMVNDIGTLRVLEAARRNSVKRVVLASSCAIYGDDPVLPKNENMEPKPMSPYAVQKLTGEFYARLYRNLYGLETVNLRYFNVYGPRQDPSSPYSGVISIFLTKAAAGQAPVIYGDGSQYRDFVFVQDVVRANLRAAVAERAVGKFFNVGTGGFIRIKDLWEMISGLAGVSAKPEYKPPRPGDIRESVADIDRARSLLGFNPEYSFEKGLKITHDWYRKKQTY